MKKNFVKIITMMMSLIFLFSCFVGCKEKNTVSLPDYTQTNKQFTIFAYGAPLDGKYNYDGVIVEYGDKDENGNNLGFRTVERYKEYKEAGFDSLLIAGSATLISDTWGDINKCEAYKCCKYATEAGIEKIFVDDALFETWINKGDSLVGDKSKSTSVVFDDEDANADGISDELFEATYNELKIYCYEFGICGTRLGDEPSWKYAGSYGKVYKAIKAAVKKLYEEGLASGKTDGIMKFGGEYYIQLNMAPIGFPGQSTYYAEAYVGPYENKEKGISVAEGKEYYTTYRDSYARYLEAFIKESGCDRLAVDVYAFRDSQIYGGTYANWQLFKEICDKYGVETTIVLQSFNQYNGKKLNYDTVSDAEMTMEIYSAIAMGATSLAYYTYMPSSNFSANGIKSLDNGCWLTRKGEKNDIYYYGQSLISDVRKIENVILNYKYKGCKLYTSSVATFNNQPYLMGGNDSKCLEEKLLYFDNSYEFKLVKGITFDNDVTFMSELYDESNDLYMYALQNVIDPRNGADGNTEQNYTVDFGDYEWVAEYSDGELTYVPLEDGVYTRTLSAGYAVFLIPLK